MRKIPLRARDGAVRAWALVDLLDFEWLNQWRWHLHATGSGSLYVARSRRDGQPHTLFMHRAIMGEPPCLVDHRDGNGLDNRRANLRLADPTLNSWNRRGADADSATGLRGVARSRNRWRAHATLRGKYHSFGTYDTPEEAAEAAETGRRTITGS